MAQDVKFACAIHGPSHMSLTLSSEKGTARNIEIIGGLDFTKWVVKIDGTADPVGNGGTVKVRSGDTITWSVSVTNRQHGVVFADKALAEALLDFATTVGQPLKDQTPLGTADPAWAAFGTNLWGTDGFNGIVVLASGKVK